MSHSLLGVGWNITPHGLSILTKAGTIGDRDILLQSALNADLKDIGGNVLSTCMAKNEVSQMVLQIQKIRNVAAPKNNEDSQAAPRMLKLVLTDGHGHIQAIESSTIPLISRDKTAPGTKIFINKAKILQGYLILDKNNCYYLGGKVPHLHEKWELAKSVQQYNRVAASLDGPPPWVNFGQKIVALTEDYNKSKNNGDASKENSEFEALRKEAIAEASSGAVKKVFGGGANASRYTAQSTNLTSKNKFDSNSKEKTTKDDGKLKATKNKKEAKEDFEKPQKAPDKVSLFAFLEDKLPVTEASKAPVTEAAKTPTTEVSKAPVTVASKAPVVQSAPVVPNFPAVTQPKNYYDINKTNGRRGRNDYGYGNYGSTHRYNQIENDTNWYRRFDISTTKSGDSTVKTSAPVATDATILSVAPDSNKKDQNQGGNFKYNPYNQRKPDNNYRGSRYNDNFGHSFEQNSYASRPNSYNKSYDQRKNNVVKPQEVGAAGESQSPKPENVSAVANLSGSLNKMSINNSEFATRSFKQHLNLESTKKSPIANASNEVTYKFNVGELCLARYWEDGKFYDAEITGMTETTYVIRFSGYGNIEEVLKNDCIPRTSKQSGKGVDHRRTAKKYISS